jgi:DNA invertase Pin-like site-specific DNA recombinase
MALIGYARVSSSGQSLDVQLEQLQAAGCAKVFQEKRSGTTTEGRAMLALALDYVREGDVLVITRLDRLARSMGDLYGILGRLKDKGVEFKVLQQGAIDTTTPQGKFMFGVLGAAAEFEIDLKKERQMEGIAKAKADGVYKGRPAKLKAADVQQALAAGEKPAHVARRLGISRNSVYRLAKAGAEAD